jgi:hypothetical protein
MFGEDLFAVHLFKYNFGNYAKIVIIYGNLLDTLEHEISALVLGKLVLDGMAIFELRLYHYWLILDLSIRVSRVGKCEKMEYLSYKKFKHDHVL